MKDGREVRRSRADAPAPARKSAAEFLKFGSAPARETAGAAARKQEMVAAGLAECHVDGVTFLHPSAWRREAQDAEAGSEISLQSEGVTFALVGVYSPDADPAEAVDEILDALRAEHPGIEVEDLSDRGWKQGGEGAEAVFISLDTVAYAWLRCWPVGDRRVLVYVQSIEPEAETSFEVFRALCRSVKKFGSEEG